MTIEEAEPAEEQQARKRAALTLGSLVLLAVVVVVLLVTLTGHTPDRKSGPLAQNVPAPSSTAHTGSSAKPSSSARRSATSSRSSTTAKPSPSAVPGDTGRLLQALNAFRSSHGVHPVSGAVTSSAVGCAASQGDASACPSSYFWEPVVGADGKQVVDKIAQHPDGPGWLLDPRIKRVEIGWKATGGGGWECAVLATY